jgi:hypothetical protein
MPDPGGEVQFPARLHELVATALFHRTDTNIIDTTWSLEKFIPGGRALDLKSRKQFERSKGNQPACHLLYLIFKYKMHRIGQPINSMFVCFFPICFASNLLGRAGRREDQPLTVRVGIIVSTGSVCSSVCTDGVTSILSLVREQEHSSDLASPA